MQIYEGMDIATAKPTPIEMSGVPHHLIGFLPASESFSVAKFKALAEACADDILSRGKLPILCGGTGLYIDTLINNTSFLDFEDNGLRDNLTRRAEKEGIETLYNELKNVDPETAGKLMLSEGRKIIRALELYYATGMTKTQQNEASHLAESKYRFCVIGLTARNRSFLYDRIDRRVDKMLDEGLLEEAARFFASERSATAKQAIGYKELKPYLDGEATLEECVTRLKAETRHYAKRQLTWFRRNQNINWLYIDENEDLLESSLQIIYSEGGAALGRKEIQPD